MLLELVAALALARDETPAPTLDNYQFAQVQRENVGDGLLKVSIENNAPSPAAGSWGVRFALDNSAGPATTVDVEYLANFEGPHTYSRRFDVRAGERRVVSLPVAADSRSGSATASGPTTRALTASAYFQAAYQGKAVVLALGRTEDYERFAGRSPDFSGDATTQVMAIAPREAPTELASYTGYDAVILPASGAFEELDEGQRRALEAYALTGGTLMFKGQVNAHALPLLSDVKSGPHPYGFGQVHVDASPSSALRVAFPISPRGQLPEYERRFNNGKVDLLLPQAAAPLARFLVIIGLFTLAIGPGSLLIARRRGPAMLLLTIPFTALVTCAVIVGSSLLSDGFTLHGASYGLTLLDSVNHRTVTLGVNAYYANLAPEKATYGAMTALAAPHDNIRGHHVADVEWADGMTLKSDFIPSRTYREWGLLSVEPTRARVVVVAKGEDLVVQNGLGHDVEQLELNVEGRLYSATSLRDGGEVRLTRRVLKWDFPHVDRFEKGPLQLVGATLGPGEFCARLVDSGFVPTGGLTVSLAQSEHWVRGGFER